MKNISLPIFFGIRKRKEKKVIMRKWKPSFHSFYHFIFPFRQASVNFLTVHSYAHTRLKHMLYFLENILWSTYATLIIKCKLTLWRFLYSHTDYRCALPQQIFLIFYMICILSPAEHFFLFQTFTSCSTFLNNSTLSHFPH